MAYTADRTDGSVAPQTFATLEEAQAALNVNRIRDDKGNEWILAGCDANDMKWWEYPAEKED